MSSIKNSKKNDAGNLLPRRRPRLGKYIALAIGLHVAFVIVYIYFTQRKPEGRPEVRSPPVKVVPLSHAKDEPRRGQAESQRAPSFRAASRPMTPSKLMSLPETDSVISPQHRSESPPMNEFIRSMKPNFITAPARKGIFSDRKADREMAAWPEKQIAQKNMRVASLSASHFAAPFPRRAAEPEPLPISGGEQLIALAEPFHFSVKRKHDTAIVDPVRSPAVHPDPYLPETDQLLPIRMEKRSLRLEPSLPSKNQMTLTNEREPKTQLLVRQPIMPGTFKLILPEKGNDSLPQKMHAAAPRMPATEKFAAQIQTALAAEPQSTAGRDQDWKSEKRPPGTTSLSFPKDSTEGFHGDRPSTTLQTAKLPAVSQKINLNREAISGAVRFEAAEKATYLSSRMVWQKDPELMPPLSNYAPLIPELPQLIEDHLSDMVKRLIQPALQKYSEPVVRVLAKNLTYRDLGLESEATKFLSGLVKAEIEKQDRVALLSPSDVSRKPHIVIEGEMWDHSDEINIRLWSLDRGSGRRISTADLSFHRKMVPDKVKIQPPPGQHLSVIQRMVELMKQNFPHGGDFQLGVWPDKGLDAVYLEGESLMVYILPEKDAYLHVDYYQIDGKVVHLLPSQQESNYVKAGASYIIGDPKGGGYEFKVSDPFGEELLVVVASQNPLGAITHSLIEPAEPYINRLVDSLGRQRNKTLMAGAHYIVLTKRRDSQK